MKKMPLFFQLIINRNIILKNQVMLFIVEKIMALILGSSSAFYIGKKFLSQNKSYSNPTNDYESPPYILTGSEYFTLEELEVYNVYIE